MKLREKETGKIRDFEIIVISEDMSRDTEFAKYAHHAPVLVCRSIGQLNEGYEKYEPKEPLIKDEKIRKAIRAWLSIQEQPITSVSVMCTKDHDGFFCYHLYGYIDEARITDGKAVVNNNLTSIDFEFRSKDGVKYDRRRDYTIDELCGEEEE